MRKGRWDEGTEQAWGDCLFGTAGEAPQWSGAGVRQDKTGTGSLDRAASKVECSAGGDKGQAATMIRPRYAAWRVKIREPKASGRYTSFATAAGPLQTRMQEMVYQSRLSQLSVFPLLGLLLHIFSFVSSRSTLSPRAPSSTRHYVPDRGPNQAVKAGKTR